MTQARSAPGVLQAAKCSRVLLWLPLSAGCLLPDVSVKEPDTDASDGMDAGSEGEDAGPQEVVQGVCPVCSDDYPCRRLTSSCRGQFADWPMPDNVKGAQTPPSYEATSADTVTDKVTQLTWQRTLPETYPPAICTGKFKTAGDSCKWEEAKRYCSSLSLPSDGVSIGLHSVRPWRLPTKIELESIVDDTRASAPMIDPVFTNNQQASMGQWTASPVAGSSGAAAWFVNFGSGYSIYEPVGYSRAVRCVR